MRQAAVEIGGIGSAPGLCVTGGVAKRDNLVLIGDRTAANGNRVGGAGIRKGAQRSGLLVGGAGAFTDANAGQASRAGGLADRNRLVTCNGPPADCHGPPARHRSEEHTSELQSLMRISYAVFCLKKQNIKQTIN